MVLDAVEEHHPEATYGVVLRGTGEATPTPSGVELRVHPDRVTWWRGSDAGTTKAG